MHYNKLGSTGLFVSELALGTMTFGASGQFEVMGSVEQSAADAMVAQAFDAGINLIDTADTYSHGAAEVILGRALKNVGKARDEVVIATKVFGSMGDLPNQQGSSRSHIFAAARASMQRLGTDYLDLYQLHGFDPATPIEESLGALDDLVRGGDVRYIGVSNWAAWQIAKALGISAVHDFTKIASLEAYYSIAGRDLEREIVPMLASENVALLVWSPLVGGLLGGTVSRSAPNADGTRRSAMAFPPVELERAYDIIDVLQAFALQKQASVAQLAIAWLLHQPQVTSVVIGARRVDQLADTLGAVDVDFSADELEQLDRVSRLPVEYPGWMIELWSGARTRQLTEGRRAS